MRDFRVVLDMAAGAQQGVDLIQAVGVARVGELGARMRIGRFDALLAVAVDAGLLQPLPAAQRIAVAGVARVGKLVMPAVSGPGMNNDLSEALKHCVTRPGCESGSPVSRPARTSMSGLFALPAMHQNQ